MAVIEVGRICVKLSGREAGSKCVIVDIIDNNFVLVTGPKNLSGVKRRRVNISHIEPTDKLVEIQKGASDQDVEAKIKEQGLIEYMKEKVKVKIPVI
ncbi:50S ribosomal protein L14e [Metallosphaera hakonensis]|uniref:Large ribosomal subunit protein eL14 n=1 Tax=Metallosphaera hakonensis JCM 8857 = DSM 7519 TaxID=1293036 RepID=A0A2U9IU07_9CREN|nr:50S ribosomal protein L14e [Metallosphaera hakonensis]AWR99516.1 50S ribosomal protein L14e [Metallosphaera hakonensis JCM 8857 = DSM 7519]